MNRIIAKVRTELDRSIELHGDWHDYTPGRMLDVIHNELLEAEVALQQEDIFGTEHSFYNELSQVAATAIKGMLVLRQRREAA